jgi:predicted ribosomally synthesized peptide with SipW-like signal peptide
MVGIRAIMRRKLLLSLGVLGVTTGVLAVGTYALFSANTTSASNLFATGTLALSNSNSVSATVTLSNMIPGDSVTGLVTIQNTGTEDLTAYQLATAVTAGTPTNPNLLTTDATNGLQIWVSRCSVAWTGSGSTATCGGTVTDVVSTSAAPEAIAPGTPFSLGSGALCTSSAAVTAATRTARNTTCTVTGNDYLRARVSLPSSAGNTFQGLSSTLGFTFQGTQATGSGF